MSTSDYVFKIKCGNILRRIRVCWQPMGPDMTFSKLEDTIRRVFKIPETSKFHLVYTDSDKDEVTMVDDDDIEDAIFVQRLNPVRVTVLAQEPHRSAHDGLPPFAGDPPLAGDHPLAGEPPSWAADIIMKLDQLLLAVNKKLVEPVVETAIISKSTRTEHHVLEGVDASPIDDSSIKPAKDVLPGEEWTDIAQARYDSGFLRRAMILRQRVMTDELND